MFFRNDIIKSIQNTNTHNCTHARLHARRFVEDKHFTHLPAHSPNSQKQKTSTLTQKNNNRKSQSKTHKVHSDWTKINRYKSKRIFIIKFNVFYLFVCVCVCVKLRLRVAKRFKNWSGTKTRAEHNLWHTCDVQFQHNDEDDNDGDRLNAIAGITSLGWSSEIGVLIVLIT